MKLISYDGANMLESGRDYDSIIASCGYEERSTFIARSMQGAVGVAMGFQFGRDDTYLKNLEWYRNSAWRVWDDLTDDEFEARLTEELASVPRGGIVAIDISSMTRRRIALSADAARAAHHLLGIDFLYAPGVLFAPDDRYSPITSSGPLKGFAGWTDSPEKPLHLAVGLGFEGRLAAGLVELLEPASVTAFLPSGSEPQFMDVVRQRNDDLLWEIALEDILEYAVDRPFDLVSGMTSLTRLIGHGKRVVIAPLGPKIFALAAVLSSYLLPGASIWRVSSGSLRNPAQRVAAGSVVGIGVRFGDEVPQE